MSASKENSHDTRAALYLVLAGVCAAMHVWKLPPALPYLQAEMGLTLVQAGFLLAIVQMGGMTLGLLVGLVAEGIGLRRCLLIGLAMLAAASAAGAYSNSVPVMMILRGVEGCGLLMATMPVPSLIRRLVHPAYLSRIMGIWSCYSPAGTVLILIAGSWLLGMGDWRMLFTLLAIVTVFMWLLIWRSVPKDTRAGREPTGQQKPASTPPADSTMTAMQMLRETLGSAAVWLVALTFGVYAAQWMAIIGFLPSVYAAAGVSGTTAGALTGVVAGANIIGNLVAGQLLHRQVAPQWLTICGFVTMLACAYATFGAGLPAPAQFVSVVILSAVGGLIPATLFYLAIAVAPSPRTTTTTVGWMQQCSALGQFSGPPIVAWVVETAGGWQWTWVATGTYAIAGIAMSLDLARRRRPAPAPDAPQLVSEAADRS